MALLAWEHMGYKHCSIGWACACGCNGKASLIPMRSVLRSFCWPHFRMLASQSCSSSHGLVWKGYAYCDPGANVVQIETFQDDTNAQASRQ